MPGINDLRNDANETQRFIPTAEPTANEIIQPVGNPQVMSMASGVRQKADFSNIPKESAREQIGIEKKVAPIQDYLGADFDKYVEDRKKEFAEYIRELELAEAIADNENDIELEIGTVEDNEKFEETIREASKFDASQMSREQITAALNKANSTPENKINTVSEKPAEYNHNENNSQVSSSSVVPENVIEPDITAEITTVKVSNEVNKAPMRLPFELKEENGILIKDEDIESTRAIDTSENISEQIEEPDLEITRGMIENKEEAVEESEDNIDVELEDEKKIDDEEDEQERLESLKAQITAKIRPVSKRLNLTGFTVAKKGTTSDISCAKETPIAKWVLPVTGITFMIKEILGSNLEKMRYCISNSDERGALQILYDHIVSPKPPFIQWMQSIAYEDYDHLYFGIYIASFADSNYLPIDCTNPKCPKKNYITDNEPVNRMIEYKDDATKAKIANLLKESPVELLGLRATEIVPITENIAFGFVNKSLYSGIVEPTFITKEFRDKYTTTLDIIPYIDNIYYIDYQNKKFIPIEWKKYENNEGKSFKMRVARYDKIISTLPSDALAVIKAYMNELIKTGNEMITYKMPETTCPHCGQVNKELKNQTAPALVFLRNQLGLLVNI